jgi:hypothetical protein
MAHVAIVGAGIGEAPCACEPRWFLGNVHRVTLINSPRHVRSRAPMDATSAATGARKTGCGFGDVGAAPAALPQNPPRTVMGARVGKWVRVAAVAFDKSFRSKVRSVSMTQVDRRRMADVVRGPVAERRHP